MQRCELFGSRLRLMLFSPAGIKKILDLFCFWIFVLFIFSFLLPKEFFYVLVMDVHVNILKLCVRQNTLFQVILYIFVHHYGASKEHPSKISFSKRDHVLIYGWKSLKNLLGNGTSVSNTGLSRENMNRWPP